MHKFTTCLWFDDQAERAAKFYTGIFKNSQILKTSYYTKSSESITKKPAGSVMTVEFELNGNQFTALNGGNDFKFNEAVSIVVNCENQTEIDGYSSQLITGGGQLVECGWLKDQFGVLWQVVPVILKEMMTDPDPEKRERVMAAMLKMKKIEISKLQAAYRGESPSLSV